MISLESYLTKIDSEKDVMIALTEKWSAINSGSFHLEGLAKMKAELEQAFAHLADNITTLKADPWERLNRQGEIEKHTLGDALLIQKRPQAKIKILIAGHMDTVFGKHHHFQTPKRIDNNTLNGPGVADLKGGLVVMLKTLEAFEQTDVARNIGWEILINADEEIGSFGSARHLEDAAKRNHLGLIFEPSLPDGSLVGERKGAGNFTVSVKGKSAHAGRDHHLGRSAILALSEFIVKAESLNGTIDDLTLNVGLVEGGEAVNAVPETAICQIDVRVKQAEDFYTLEKKLNEIVATLNKKEGITLKLKGDLKRPPKAFSEKIKKIYKGYQDCAEQLGLTLNLRATGGCCDGNNLAAAGLPNLDTLGVRGGHIHSDQEFVLLDSLTERAKLSFLFLTKIANGDIQI